MNQYNLTHDNIRPVSWVDNHLRLLDQRKLPENEVYLDISSTQGVHDAIKNMCVRGAPAIGITAAFGAVIAAQEITKEKRTPFTHHFAKKLDLLASSRPTATNLFNALSAAKDVAARSSDPTKTLLTWAKRWMKDDIESNKKMGRLGAQFLNKNSSVLTHCNTGSLATGGYGTALGVIRSAYSHGLIKQVYASETRPWNQGSRLTIWELQHERIPSTLIVDSAAASLMQHGLIDWLIVGADSIATNGDVANKIGTYSLAVLAKHHSVKVMVAAPMTTVDKNTKNGADIIIEQRSKEELLQGQYHPKFDLIDAFNPVFDVTPAELISVIVTEKGVIESPDARKMSDLIEQV